jgi:hypothetical protein
MPTTSGGNQQKNRQPIFGDVETRLKMTFHSPGENQRAARRKRKPLSKTPLLFFHYENVFRKKGKTISIQTHPNLIISPTRVSRMPKLPNPSNHKDPATHKAGNQSNASSLCPLCPLWFNLNGPDFRFLQDQIKTSDHIQEIARHPLASFASFCSKKRQRVTQRAQQPAGHSRFLLPMAIFAQKNCAPLVRSSHKCLTSTCDPLFSQTSPVSRNVPNTCEKNTCDL